MQSLLQTFYDTHLHAFLDRFLWLDLCWICIFILLVHFVIIQLSKKIVEKNTLYNSELLKFRTEVYHFYEKNFFL